MENQSVQQSADLRKKNLWHSWSEDKVRKFIQLYEERPLLWRKNDADYANKVKRASATQEIARLMDCKEKDVFDAWKALRDNCRKKMKLMNPIKSGSGRKKRKTWIYYKDMNFINTQASESGPIDNMLDIENISLQTSESQSSLQTATPPPNCTASSATPSSSKKPKRNTEISESKAILKEFLSELKQKPDEFELFGGLVAIELRTVQKNGGSYTFIERTKMKIRNVLSEALLESLEQLESNLIPSTSTSTTDDLHRAMTF